MRKTITSFLIGILNLFFLHMSYADLCFDKTLTLDTGYRWDKISNRIVASGPTVAPSGSTQLANKLQTCLLGGIAKWKYRGVIFKGTYHYGKIMHGHYDETGFFGESRGYTLDAAGGLGYLFCLGDCWGIIPSGGWGYDKLHINGRDVSVGNTGSLVPVGIIEYYSRFQGPYFGLEFYYEPYECFHFGIGYELHHAHWHGSRKLRNGDLGATFGLTTGFSNERENKNVWGNIIHLEGAYRICERFEAGLGLKYQIWKGGVNGSYKQTETLTDPTITSQLATDIEWESFSATLQIGYIF